MPTLLDVDLYAGTPLEAYLGDAIQWLEDAGNDPDEVAKHALDIATEHRDLFRAIQVLVMANKVTWEEVGKAIDLAGSLQ